METNNGSFREPSMEVVIGQTGIGKTFTTQQIIKDYIRNGPGWKSRPVLVFDVNGEYEDYKAIDFDIAEDDEYIRAAEIRAIKVPKAYRIIPYRKDGKFMDIDEVQETCITLVDHFRNGLLVLEDINKYTLSHFKKEVTGTFIGLRHKGMDIIIHYQGMKHVPPRVWQNIHYLRWHKQVENIDNYKDRMPNFEICKISEFIVNDQFDSGNIRFHLWVDIRYNRIIGVNQEMFDRAARNYLSLNPREIKNMMYMLDDNNSRKYSHESDAISDWIANRRGRYLK